MVGDVWIPRIAVSFLGLVALASSVSIAALAINKDEIPPALAGVGTAAVSVLGVVVTGALSSRPPQALHP